MIENCHHPFNLLITVKTSFASFNVERVAMQNNIEIDKTVAQSEKPIQLSNIACMHPHAPSETVPNNTRELDPFS